MRKSLAIVMVLMLTLVLVGTAAAEELDKKTLSDSMFEEIGEYGGQYSLSLGSSPQTFNYYGSLDQSSLSIMLNVFDSLTEPNPLTMEIEPALASDWEIKDEGKTVIFHLREGVEWSDGEPFTADDVIFTFNEIALNSDVERSERDRFTLEGEVVEFSKIDDMTVKAELPVAYGPFFDVLSHAPIFPKHQFEQYVSEDDPSKINDAWATDSDLSEIVGTGPYKLSSYSPDQRVVLERNPNHWKFDPDGNRLPYVDQLEYLIIGSEEVQLAQFESGAIDSLSISGQDFTYLKQQEVDGADFSVYATASTAAIPSPTHFGFNFDVEDENLREAFRNVDFRIALEYLMDRERIIEEVYNTLAMKSGTPVFETFEEWYNPEIEEIRRENNIEKAAEILDELGYVDENGDGYRQFPDGERLEFDLTSGTSSERSDIAGIVADKFEEVGIEVHLNLIDDSLVMDQALAGDFQTIIMAYGNQPDPQFRKDVLQPGRDLYYMHQSIRGEDGTDKDLMFDWEAEVFDIFEEGQVTMEYEERKELYDRWQVLFAENLPVIFLTKGMTVQAVQNDIGNLFLNEDDVIVNSNLTIFKK